MFAKTSADGLNIPIASLACFVLVPVIFIAVFLTFGLVVVLTSLVLVCLIVAPIILLETLGVVSLIPSNSISNLFRSSPKNDSDKQTKKETGNEEENGEEGVGVSDEELQNFGLCPECEEVVRVDVGECPNCGLSLGPPEDDEDGGAIDEDESEEVEEDEGEEEDVELAKCPICDSLIPITSDECPECGVGLLPPDDS